MSFDSIGHAEETAFLGNAREEYDLQQQITQLLAERGRVAVVERLECFVRFFEEVRAQGRECLLAIPRTAFR